MFKNIIWDVDGTLFDTYPAIASAYVAAMKDLGKEVPAGRVFDMAKISLNFCVASLSAEYQVNPEDIDRAFDQHYDRVRPEDQPPFPGVKEICEYITVIGGRNVIVTHRGRDGLEELLTAYSMSHLFAGSVTRDDGYPRKPDPAAFDAALRMHALSTAETLTVGDRGIDIQAGQKAGVFTCLFGGGSGEVKPDLVISSYDELLRFLREQAAQG